jgi:hypothetical protein
MALTTGTARIVGTTPLLMHSDATVDSTHPLAVLMQPIKDKRKKTESDLTTLERFKWMSAMYVHDGRPVIPAYNVMRSWRDGGTYHKAGQKIMEALIIEGSMLPVHFEHEDLCSGPDGWQRLYDIRLADGKRAYVDRRTVNNNPSAAKKTRVIGVRPVFYSWSIDLSFRFEDDLLNPNDMRRALEAAGALKGLGDFRPLFGRYTVDNWQIQ